MKYTKLLPISLGLIIIIAAFSIVYGFIAHGSFTMRYVFNANFLAGIILIVAGIVLMFIPTIFSLWKEKLLDHSTYVEKSYDSREYRQQKARMILWLGLFNMILTGLIQLLLSVII